MGKWQLRTENLLWTCGLKLSWNVKNFGIFLIKLNIFKFSTFKAFNFQFQFSALMLCATVFIFTSGSSALLGRPRCGLWIWLSLLAIFNTLFWGYANEYECFSSIFVFCPFSRENFWHELTKVYWIWQVATVRSINHNVGALKELSYRK